MHVKRNDNNEQLLWTALPMARMLLLSVLYTGRKEGVTLHLQGALCCCLCFTQEGELYREPYAALCALHKKEGGEDFTGSPMLLSVLTQEGGSGRLYTCREPYAAACFT